MDGSTQPNIKRWQLWWGDTIQTSVHKQVGRNSWTCMSLLSGFCNTVAKFVDDFSWSSIENATSYSPYALQSNLIIQVWVVCLVSDNSNELLTKTIWQLQFASYSRRCCLIFQRWESSAPCFNTKFTTSLEFSQILICLFGATQFFSQWWHNLVLNAFRHFWPSGNVHGPISLQKMFTYQAPTIRFLQDFLSTVIGLLSFTTKASV